MKKLFQNSDNKICLWLDEIYGYDELSTFLSVVSMLLVFLSRYIRVFALCPFVIVVWLVIRTFSRNTRQREKELNVYLKYVRGIKRWLRRRKNMLRERKTHRFYKCPKCKAVLRVPRGKGQIKISCPKCRSSMIRKT